MLPFLLTWCAIWLKHCPPWTSEVDDSKVQTTLAFAHWMWSFAEGSSGGSEFLREYILLMIIGCLDWVFFLWILTFSFGFRILLEDCAFSLGFCLLWGGKRYPQKSKLCNVLSSLHFNRWYELEKWALKPCAGWLGRSKSWILYSGTGLRYSVHAFPTEGTNALFVLSPLSVYFPLYCPVLVDQWERIPLHKP